jgi:3-deoxy-manno-octulosonate cytidylyltransferase (CMP-KDO synthetase)
MKATAIIPARYNSTRFPGKPLALIHGKPVIQYVYENAKRAKEIARVIVATDNNKISDIVSSFGGEVRMTSPDLPSGSDRVAEVAKTIDSDIIVNVQGDEPLLSPDMIDLTVDLLKNSDADMGTLAKKIEDVKEIFNPNTVKVVFAKNGIALYFSRSPIPYYRDFFMNGQNTHGLSVSSLTMYKHIGIYSYRKAALLNLTKLPPSKLEQAEKLEQLRALENGYSIKIALTDRDTIGVDTPGDLERVGEWLNISS